MVPILPLSDAQTVSGYVESEMIAAGYMEGGKDSCQVREEKGGGEWGGGKKGGKNRVPLCESQTSDSNFYSGVEFRSLTFQLFNGI